MILKKIFVNHTNHPSDKWSPEQIAAAEKFGAVVDFPFPNVDANADEEKISELVEVNGQKILAMNPAAVLCQGEFSYTFAMVNFLQKNNLPVLAASSARVVEEIVTEDGSTQRISLFKFVRFRQYK